jgi:hypothetical protein
LFRFHDYCAKRFCDENLDFLVAVSVFKHLWDKLIIEDPNSLEPAARASRTLRTIASVRNIRLTATASSIPEHSHVHIRGVLAPQRNRCRSECYTSRYSASLRLICATLQREQ